MNKSKIAWCDHTWSPITGCRYDCAYCYASKTAERFSGDVRLNLMAKKDYHTETARDNAKPVYILDKPMLNETGKALAYPFGFEPTYHRYRMDVLDKLKMGNNIFVGAMADIFGEWVPDAWLDDVFKVCLNRPQHNYLFLTRNPDRFISYGVPIEMDNMWYGTTITGTEDIDKISALLMDGKTFVCIEPLHERLSIEDIQKICKTSNWIIIGVETGRNNKKIMPEFEWIKDIVLGADNEGIPVFMEDSLIPVVGEENMRKEFPEELKRKTLSKKQQIKLFDNCCICKKEQRKKDMITLLAKRCRGIQAKQYGFMCIQCYENFCNTNNLKIPEFQNMEDK